MKIRLALMFACLPWAAWAQLQLFVFDGTTETAAAAVTDYGTVASGDVRVVRFHARNTGVAAVALQTLSLAGQGFTISSAPSLPYIVAPNNFLEIRVQFSATTIATYSATLAVNQTLALLRAAVAAAVTISPLGGSPLTTNSTIDFGNVQTGQSSTRNLQLSNPSNAALTIQACSIAGAAFQASALKCPLSLAAGTSVTITISFTPSASGPLIGTVTFDNRTFLLSGSGLNPPLPKPSISFNKPLASGTQQRLVVQLDSRSQATGAGTVSLTFEPASAGMNDDPAIVFTSTGSRNLSFQVDPGDQTGRFPAGVDTTFQTGTTAGTITFHVVLGSFDQKFQFPVAPSLINVDTPTAVRRPGNVDLSLTGFDNTGTAGKFSFTFYNTSGGIVQPGAVSADWSESFWDYFRSSKTGGSFTMRVTFPVSGDMTQLSGVQVQMTNSAGTASTVQIAF